MTDPEAESGDQGLCPHTVPPELCWTASSRIDLERSECQRSKVFRSSDYHQQCELMVCALKRSMANVVFGPVDQDVARVFE